MFALELGVFASCIIGVVFLESKRPYAIVILYLLPHEHQIAKLLKFHCFLLSKDVPRTLA